METSFSASRIDWKQRPSSCGGPTRTLGVDLLSGDGLDAALAGVDAVVDAVSSPPIAPDDIVQVLAEIAAGEPKGRYVDVAGHETQDLVDMARRTNDVLGRKVKLVPTWSGPLDLSMVGNVLLPGEKPRIAPTTFEQWLAAGAR